VLKNKGELTCSKSGDSRFVEELKTTEEKHVEQENAPPEKLTKSDVP